VAEPRPPRSVGLRIPVVAPYRSSGHHAAGTKPPATSPPELGLTTYLTTYPFGTTGVAWGSGPSLVRGIPAQRGPEGVSRRPKIGRPSDYESEGRRFESCRARFKKLCFAGFLVLSKSPAPDTYHLIDHLSVSPRLRGVPAGAVHLLGARRLERPMSGRLRLSPAAAALHARTTEEAAVSAVARLFAILVGSRRPSARVRDSTAQPKATKKPPYELDRYSY
jgi:hypothetical protein